MMDPPLLPTSWPLQPHPATPCPLSLAVQVQLRRPAAARLELRYQLRGDWGSIVLPHGGTPAAATDGLWRHTCMEAFIGHGRGTGYHEFNFSPAGHWAVYAFASPRQRSGNPSAGLHPRIHVQTSADVLQISVRTPLPGVLQQPNPLALGLSAVLAHDDGTRSFWALTHPCDHPDFHARAGWLAVLPPTPTQPD